MRSGATRGVCATGAYGVMVLRVGSSTEYVAGTELCRRQRLSRLRGGELNAALTSALVGIHTNYLGRGPKTASTFYQGNGW